MFDSFNREINYLRISITDRCNLHCDYCVPNCKIIPTPEQEKISTASIIEFVKTAHKFGIKKVRLTGGEPLVHPDILNIVKSINDLKILEELTITTNGQLLARFAEDLKKNGINRINISLDTLDPAEYHRITGGILKKTIDGINSAIAVGMNPIKLNCVVNESSEEPNAQSVLTFANENNLSVRFIKKMDLSAGKFWQVDGGVGGNCQLCNRIRLTCDGIILPCLFSDQGISIKEFGMEEALKKAICGKPKKGEVNTKKHFINLGG